MNRKLPCLGVLGGGQLARMLAIAAAPLGVRTLVVDGADDACAGQVAELVVADWNDEAALAEFARRVDVVTFDFENVPAATAEKLAALVDVFPNPRALAIAQDRLAEKTLFRESGLNTPEFEPVDTRDDLIRAVERIGLPAVLKTRRLGYDGKGQFRLKEPADIDAAWAALGEAAARVGLILEAFVPFDREVSVVAVRGRDGSFRSWPLTRNWHVDGVLSLSLAPAPGSTDELERTANAHARTIAEKMDYVGVFALELFVRDGELLGNEMAPVSTIRGTGPSKAPTPASSRTTCVPCWACRWATRACAVAAPCSTGSATCLIRRRCFRWWTATGTTTARRPVRAARWAMPRYARRMPAHCVRVWPRQGRAWAVRRR